MLLAPIVKNQKGEHKILIQNLIKQGFVRALVNDMVVHLDEIGELEKNKKHTIDAVIDRFTIKKEIEPRLIESLSACLEIGDGVAKVVEIDNYKNSHMLSSKYACSECGHSLGVLDPVLFSFNNPAGACVKCSGLGVEQLFSEKLIVRNENLSINQGVLIGWGPDQIYSFSMLKAVANHCGVDLDMPYVDIDQESKDIILYGSKYAIEMRIKFPSKARETKVKKKFEGVIKNYTRRFLETDSDFVRNELKRFMSVSKCKACNGGKLNPDALNVFIDNHSINDITSQTIQQAYDYLSSLKLHGNKKIIGERILEEINNRLHFLCSVGLTYLTLDRASGTLSGGEAQRIRLASQLGSHLVGVTYVLDEPSIGLHQRDNDRLLQTMVRLRDLGNTVVVVEHDFDAIKAADHIIDVGPRAGEHGGEIIAIGDYEQIKNNKKSLTGQYLSGEKKIAVPKKRVKKTGENIILKGASGNNLNDVDLEIPLGLFTCITGVSGSGKSTLINKTLYPLITNNLGKHNLKHVETYSSIENIDNIDKIISIDQSPIGKTPRSNPATYVGIFDGVREIFSNTAESKARGYKPGRFSFNVKGGRCESCSGDGVLKIEMHFLPDVYVECDVCKGSRYNQETLQIEYKDKNIYQILQMTVEKGLSFFENISSLHNRLQALFDVGLGYITLGHPATHLSGGEAQRVKLAKELSKKQTGNSLYLLDEPTTGLHFEDINKLLSIFYQLRDKGNSLVVIEHNLDVIKCADWVVDLGPEGGQNGGDIIAVGTPEQVAKVKSSYTGNFLKEYL
jgi:excinuclease ABC subunit A